MTAPYYQDESVTLYHGDWRELTADDFRADLIVTDPPYGETSLSWDRWPSGWPALAARHADAMWCFGSMRMFLEQRTDFADWRLSQDVVWEKHNGPNAANDRFARVHEHALHWYRGPWSDVHHIAPTTSDATPRTVRRKAKAAHWQGARGASVYTSQDGGPRLMRSVLYERSMHGSAINETEKPVPLLEPLIEYGCPSGGLVVDFHAGSASTLVAARRIGRRAVGFELRESQCEQAALRLAQGVLDFGEGA
ncbi:site-specific DNA-methyltransferase [Yimella sp. cx-573]|nr:site-specific DNA-methyltransferase [Yimella sp. cx-573]